MPKSKKARKSYRAKRQSQSRDILAVRMKHDTRWSKGGDDFAMVEILVPPGSVYAPRWIHTKRWIPLDGRMDIHAEALDNFKTREFKWRVHTWVLARTPSGEEYVESTDFQTTEAVQLEALEELAARYKEENYNAINPRHFVARGWKAETIANNNKKEL